MQHSGDKIISRIPFPGYLEQYSLHIGFCLLLSPTFVICYQCNKVKSGTNGIFLPLHLIAIARIWNDSSLSEGLVHWNVCFHCSEQNQGYKNQPQLAELLTSTYQLALILQ